MRRRSNGVRGTRWSRYERHSRPGYLVKGPALNRPTYRRRPEGVAKAGPTPGEVTIAVVDYHGVLERVGAYLAARAALPGRSSAEGDLAS